MTTEIQKTNSEAMQLETVRLMNVEADRQAEKNWDKTIKNTYNIDDLRDKHAKYRWEKEAKDLIDDVLGNSSMWKDTINRLLKPKKD